MQFASAALAQLALEPLWRAYEACEPGADARGILGKMLKGLNLQQVFFGSAAFAVLRGPSSFSFHGSVQIEPHS
jgi:hypothetical protein